MSIFAGVHSPNEAWLALAEPETAIEPDLPIVDPHLHLWDLGGYRYFIEEYARDLAHSGHRVDAAVFVECFMAYRAKGPEHMKYVGETEFAVGMAAMAASEKYTKAKVGAAIVGYADMSQGAKTREVIEAHVEAGNGRFRGVRQRAKWDPDPLVRGTYCAAGPGLYREAEFGRGIDVLTSLGLSFDASIFHPQIPDVTALARAHPDAVISVNHTASPVGHTSYAGREAEVHAAWLRDMKELATCPNVSIKMGGLLMCLGNFDYTKAPRPPTSAELAELWRPYIEPCIELFGADRCMASSNFPVDKAGMTYGTVWNMFKRIISGCSADEQRLIMAGTAKRVYRLGTD
jgi:L-fuconolactonase